MRSEAREHATVPVHSCRFSHRTRRRGSYACRFSGWFRTVEPDAIEKFEQWPVQDVHPDSGFGSIVAVAVPSTARCKDQVATVGIAALAIHSRVPATLREDGAARIWRMDMNGGPVARIVDGHRTSDRIADLQAAASQVEVARKNIQVTTQNLDLTRQKFEAGVSDNVEVVQSQEALSTANTDYINSVFAHNLAKLSLARAVGRASEVLPQFLKLQ